MYTDSRLATKTPSMFAVWFTRVLVFLICIAVGTAGSVFVRQLSTDPRKEVRKQLSSQLAEQTKNVETLTKDVNALRAQVEEEAKSVSSWSLNETIQDDEMVNGVLPVQGEGITLTIANPLSVGGDNAGFVAAKRKRQSGSCRHGFGSAGACLATLAVRSGSDRHQRIPSRRADFHTNGWNDDPHRSQFRAKSVSHRGDRQFQRSCQCGEQENTTMFVR